MAASSHATVFNQGDEGTSWYVILKGSVNVVIHGKGVVTTLQDGDDFGQLALINNAPRYCIKQSANTLLFIFNIIDLPTIPDDFVLFDQRQPIFSLVWNYIVCCRHCVIKPVRVRERDQFNNPARYL